MDNPSVAKGGSDRPFSTPLNAKNIPSNACGLPSSAMNGATVDSTAIAGQNSNTPKKMSVSMESNYSKSYPVSTEKLSIPLD
ncbi:MAG TPA: hypothetical protein VL443_08350 [Cyclobacteriaceae bacterium]|jgi:hypothetical protein|nr:hypothetical protein [Cyclobacteriaceae bacterium]